VPSSSSNPFLDELQRHEVHQPPSGLMNRHLVLWLAS
jgi:hypothetical protein